MEFPCRPQLQPKRLPRRDGPREAGTPDRTDCDHWAPKHRSLMVRGQPSHPLLLLVPDFRRLTDRRLGADIQAPFRQPALCAARPSLARLRTCP